MKRSAITRLLVIIGFVVIVFSVPAIANQSPTSTVVDIDQLLSSPPYNPYDDLRQNLMNEKTVSDEVKVNLVLPTYSTTVAPTTTTPKSMVTMTKEVTVEEYCRFENWLPGFFASSESTLQAQKKTSALSPNELLKTLLQNPLLDASYFPSETATATATTTKSAAYDQSFLYDVAYTACKSSVSMVQYFGANCMPSWLMTTSSALLKCFWNCWQWFWTNTYHFLILVNGIVSISHLIIGAVSVIVYVNFSILKKLFSLFGLIGKILSCCRRHHKQKKKKDSLVKYHTLGEKAEDIVGKAAKKIRSKLAESCLLHLVSIKPIPIDGKGQYAFFGIYAYTHPSSTSQTKFIWHQFEGEMIEMAKARFLQTQRRRQLRRAEKSAVVIKMKRTLEAPLYSKQLDVLRMGVDFVQKCQDVPIIDALGNIFENWSDYLCHAQPTDMDMMRQLPSHLFTKETNNVFGRVSVKVDSRGNLVSDFEHGENIADEYASRVTTTTKKSAPTPIAGNVKSAWVCNDENVCRLQKIIDTDINISRTTKINFDPSQGSILGERSALVVNKKRQSLLKELLEEEGDLDTKHLHAQLSPEYHSKMFRMALKLIKIQSTTSNAIKWAQSWWTPLCRVKSEAEILAGISPGLKSILAQETTEGDSSDEDQEMPSSTFNLEEVTKGTHIVWGEPITYEEFCETAQVGDMIAIRGSHQLSRLICQIQGLMREGHSLFSHEGILVNTTVFYMPGMIAGEWYLLESAVGGEALGEQYDSMPDVMGLARSGVQVRSMRGLLSNSLAQHTLMFLCPLSPVYRKMWDDCVGVKPRSQKKSCRLIEFMPIIINKRYTLTISNFLVGAANQHVNGKESARKRVTRASLKSQTKLGQEFFCSELCAAIYQHVGLLPPPPGGVIPWGEDIANLPWDENQLANQFCYARQVYPVDFFLDNGRLPYLFGDIRFILPSEFVKS